MATSEELQLRKLEHEVEKLTIEVHNMSRPVRAFLNNPASYFTLLSVLVGLAAYLGQSYVNDARSERSKTELLLTELRKKELDQENDVLAKKKADLELDSQRIWTEYSNMLAQRDKTRDELASLTVQINSAQLELQAKGQSSATLNAVASQARELGAAVSPKPTGLDARIYIQVASTEDRLAAQDIASLLRDKGRVVPEIEVVGSKAASLKQTELRYFWDFDEAEAREILRKVQDTGRYGIVDLRLPAGLKGKTRPRQFELWIKPA